MTHRVPAAAVSISTPDELAPLWARAPTVLSGLPLDQVRAIATTIDLKELTPP